LAARFVRGAVPKEEWTHAAHLTVGAWHVRQFGPVAAIDRLRTGIRALNDRHGTQNGPDSGYHETVTIAYVRLIDQYLLACDAGLPFESCVAGLLAGSFAERALLLRFWSRARLMSTVARALWTPPDLAPLILPPDVAPRGFTSLPPTTTR